MMPTEDRQTLPPAGKPRLYDVVMETGSQFGSDDGRGIIKAEKAHVNSDQKGYKVNVGMRLLLKVLCGD